MHLDYDDESIVYLDKYFFPQSFCVCFCFFVLRRRESADHIGLRGVELMEPTIPAMKEKLNLCLQINLFHLRGGSRNAQDDLFGTTRASAENFRIK